MVCCHTTSAPVLRLRPAFWNTLYNSTLPGTYVAMRVMVPSTMRWYTAAYTLPFDELVL